jgi:UDP-glucose 4-epimerase
VHLIARAGSSFERIADLRPLPASTRLELSDTAALDACVRQRRPDVVFHLAGLTAARGPTPQGDAADDLLHRSFDVNLGGTMRVLQAILREAPAARVIRTGGLAEYGTAPIPFHEEQREQPISSYGASQVAATYLGQALARQFGLAVTTIRPALVYGPAQSESFFIPALIRACLAGHAFEMTSGEQTRDIIYVDDIVDALVETALTAGLAGRVLNAGSGKEYRIRDVADLIVHQTGGRTALRVERPAAGGADLQRLACDSQLIRQLVGWQARTPIESGLERTIAWYRVTG